MSQEDFPAPTIPAPPLPAMTDDERLVRARAFADELHRRRTVRDFAPTPVPREVIEHCLANRSSSLVNPANPERRQGQQRRESALKLGINEDPLNEDSPPTSRP